MFKKFVLLILIVLLNSILIAEKAEPFLKVYKRGNVFLKHKKYEQAISAYQKSIKLNPDFAQSYLNIGVIYDQHIHQYGKAIKYYIMYLEKGGKKVAKVKEWIRNIANLKHLTSDKEYKQLKKGVKYYNQGVKLGKKKRYSEAIKMFAKAIEIIPYYAKAHYTIGLAFYNKENFGKAYKHFMMVLKYDPDNKEFLESYYYLGRLHDDVLIKDYDHALQFYNLYKEHHGNKAVGTFIRPIKKVNNLLNQAYQDFQKNKKKEALVHLKKAQKIKPMDVRIYNNMAAIQINRKKYQQAESLLKKVMNIRKDVADTYYNYACLYAKQKKIKKALEYYKKGLEYFSLELIKHSLKDKDLINLSEQVEFKELVKSYIH